MKECEETLSVLFSDGDVRTEKRELWKGEEFLPFSPRRPTWKGEKAVAGRAGGHQTDRVPDW